MATLVALNATNVKPTDAFDANDPPAVWRLVLRMPRPTQIYSGKTPPRTHYIPEWAERRNMSQADIVEVLGADKSTVSRWFSGAVPTNMYLIPLAELLGADEPAGLFRHPDDDWMARLLRLRERSKEERERIKTAMEALFAA